MFEIRMFVEDNKLHRLLWAVDGIAVGMPQATPVRNAIAKNGQVREKAPEGEGMVPKVAAKIREWDASKITSLEMGQLVVKAGYKKTGTWHVANSLVEQGLLKWLGRGVYGIIKKG